MDRFVLFGGQHLAALGLIVLAGVAGTLAVRGGERVARVASRGVAVVLLGLFLVEDLVAWRQGWLTLQVALPFHLCDVARVLVALGLLTRDPRVIGPAYFFTLAGLTPSLFTPDVKEAFPSVNFVSFFVPHGLTVVALGMLVVGYRQVPGPGAWLRSWLLLNALAVAVTPVNVLGGTNFLFLMAKPPSPTPFDWLGPWPAYLAVLEVVVFVLFWLLDLPLRAARLPPPPPAPGTRASA